MWSRREGARTFWGEGSAETLKNSLLHYRLKSIQQVDHLQISQGKFHRVWNPIWERAGIVF